MFRSVLRLRVKPRVARASSRFEFVLRSVRLDVPVDGIHPFVARDRRGRAQHDSLGFVHCFVERRHPQDELDLRAAFGDCGDARQRDAACRMSATPATHSQTHEHTVRQKKASESEGGTCGRGVF